MKQTVVTTPSSLPLLQKRIYIIYNKVNRCLARYSPRATTTKRPTNRLQLSHRNHPQKISVSELGVIFWGSPLFLAVFGHSHFRGATTLNFGPISTKLGGIVRTIKKMTQKDNGPGPGRNYGETGVFTFTLCARAG